MNTRISHVDYSYQEVLVWASVFLDQIDRWEAGLQCSMNIHTITFIHQFHLFLPTPPGFLLSLFSLTSSVFVFHALRRRLNFDRRKGWNPKSASVANADFLKWDDILMQSHFLFIHCSFLLEIGRGSRMVFNWQLAFPWLSISFSFLFFLLPDKSIRGLCRV